MAALWMGAEACSPPACEHFTISANPSPYACTENLYNKTLDDVAYKCCGLFHGGGDCSSGFEPGPELIATVNTFALCGMFGSPDYKPCNVSNATLSGSYSGEFCFTDNVTATVLDKVVGVIQRQSFLCDRASPTSTPLPTAIATPPDESGPSPSPHSLKTPAATLPIDHTPLDNNSDSSRLSVAGVFVSLQSAVALFWTL